MASNLRRHFKPLLPMRDCKSRPCELSKRTIYNVSTTTYYALAADATVPDAIRIAAIRTTVQLAKSDTKVEMLRKLLADQQPAVREAALTALVVDLQDLETARNVLGGKGDEFTIAACDAVATMSLNTPGGAI